MLVASGAMNRALALWTAAGAATAAACTNLFGFDDLRLARNDAGPSGGAAAMVVCDHRAPPVRPSVVDAGGSLDLVFALASAATGFGRDAEGRPRYQSMGYDLDSTCTGWGQGPSCLEPSWATQYDDGMGGIDNALSAVVFREIGPTSVPLPDPQGTSHSILIRVRGYSGGRDDDRVEVSVYAGLNVAPRPAPLWDGADVWSIHQGSLERMPDGGVDVDHPKFVDQAAYVSGYVLVARMPEIDIGTGSPVAPDYLSHYVQYLLTANLVPTSNGWELHQGISAGRARLADTLRDIAMAPSMDNPADPVCQHKSEYEAIKQQTCAHLDIAATTDSPSAACDAFSLGLQFEARPAQLGKPGPAPGDPPPCAPDVHVETETCP